MVGLSHNSYIKNYIAIVNILLVLDTVSVSPHEYMLMGKIGSRIIYFWHDIPITLTT